MWDLKFALKSLKKSLGITLINVLGFSLGLSAIFFLVQYLTNEYSFDDFHKNKGQIYRIAIKSYENGQFEDETFVYTSEVGKAIKSDFPEVDEYVSLTTPSNDVFYLDNAPHKINDYIYAGASFFDVFSFQLKEGDPDKVLLAPYSIVLTETLAKNLFGNEEPVGRQLVLNEEPYTITGVAQNPPTNTDLGFNMLVSFSTRYKQKNVHMGWNGGNQYVHYVKLVSKADPLSIEKKADAFMWKYINKDYEEIGIKDLLYLQPLSDIHFRYNPESASLKRNMLIFSVIAILLLAIVIINFVNLFIANASKQLRNMGIVKVHGASRVQTLKHLLLEISIMILFSILVALTLVQFLHPYFEALAGKAVPSLMESGWTFALILLGIVMATTFLAGIFPSFLISSVQPSKIIKNELTVGQSGKKLKNGLVVFQFVVSIFLIVGTITSEKQLNYMNRFDTGYNKENVLVLPLQTQELQQKIDLLKEELNQMSLVKNVSAVSEVPYNGLAMNGYFPEGRTTPEMINVIDVDEDFLALLDISMVSGNNFAKNMATDDNSYLVNESFVKKMGWENPIGKTITRNGEHKIIGVVKDFNFASLRSNINPLIITNASEIGPPNFLLVKSDRANLSQLIGDIENKWKAISPNSLFEYQFLDQQFEKVYRAELSIQKLLRSFSFLTILVALLGLLGLSRSSINNRIKEIGIRKVNGASSQEVLALLNKDYVKLILLSFLIAVPLAWYAMHKWLESFAYQTSLSWWIFALAGGITLLVALLTVSWQTIKASRTNPANSLKTE